VFIKKTKIEAPGEETQEGFDKLKRREGGEGGVRVERQNLALFEDIGGGGTTEKGRGVRRKWGLTRCVVWGTQEYKKGEKPTG